jgi:pimeloyl-ACP methyl ester carboxylesterase/DNA-binding CsgD family transcriptional regulator
VGFCEVAGGGRIAYASVGTGPPLVMVPGWLSHVTELWSHPAAASALAKLSRGHQFVWYDRLGCGLSDRDRRTLSLDDDVAQLVAVLDALAIERCDLIGYSFGGPVGAVFARRHPERVRHLVLYSTYVRGADLADEAPYAALVELVRSGWDLASVTLASLFLPDATRADLRWFTRFQRRSVDPAMAADLLLFLRTQDVSDVLPEVRVPTTVVTAKDDRVVPPRHARELARLIPGARLVTVEGRAHDPFIRDAGDVVDAILAAVEGRPMQVTDSATLAPPIPSLTSREADVLRAVVAGSSNKSIAGHLGVSVATVERHLTNLYRKLGATGRADAAVRAIGAGLASPGRPTRG